MLRLKIAIICSVLIQFVSAQNLVVNGSFEEYSSCPDNAGQLNRATPWKSLPTDEIELFHSCSSNALIKTPIELQHSTIFPKSGEGIAGFFACNGFGGDYRDYLHQQLKSNLKANKHYYVEWFLITTSTCSLAVKSIGMNFSANQIAPYTTNKVLNLNSNVFNAKGYLNDTLNWMKISGIYKANGQEKYITIGNFLDDASSDMIVSYGDYPGIEFFIDDISVIPVDSISGGISASAGPDHTIFTNDSVFIGQNMSGNFCNWYHNGNLISQHTEFGFYVKPTQAVNQYVVIQDLGGVIDSDTAYVYVKDASIKPIQKQLLSIAPNPSTGSFLLHFGNSALSEINVHITDINGRTIENRTLQLSNGQANLELTEPNGMYLMYLHHPLGEEIQKLIIQK